MEFGSYAVVKAEPELFWIMLANPKEPVPKGFQFQTSKPMNEDKMRDVLVAGGVGKRTVKHASVQHSASASESRSW